MILLEKNNKETGKEYAYRVLKENIMMLELKPGEIISELDLSNKLNISRTPIREVLMKLKGEHLINVKPQIGTFVSDIDENLIEQAILMRVVLEKEIIKIACNEFDEKYLIELEKNLFAQKLLLKSENNTIEFHKLDRRFHKTIFEGCNKVDIWESIKRISTHYDRMRLLSDMQSNKEVLVSHHEILLNIIKNKDIDNIDDYIYLHIVKPTENWEIE